MTQIWGILALRLANADVLPFDYSTYAQELQVHLETLKEEKADLPISAESLDQLQTLLTQWEQTAMRLDGELSTRLNDENQPIPREINQQLYQLERTLTDQAGLPRRPWFKHLIYAPGFNTGYAAVIFPGIVDALETDNSTQVSLEANRLSEAFQQVINKLEVIRATERR